MFLYILYWNWSITSSYNFRPKWILHNHGHIKTPKWILHNHGHIKGRSACILITHIDNIYKLLKKCTI